MVFKIFDRLFKAVFEYDLRPPVRKFIKFRWIGKEAENVPGARFDILYGELRVTNGPNYFFREVFNGYLEVRSYVKGFSDGSVNERRGEYRFGRIRYVSKVACLLCRHRRPRGLCRLAPLLSTWGSSRLHHLRDGSVGRKY